MKKVVFFGTDEFVVPILETLAKEFDLLTVVTISDSFQGRRKILTPTPVKMTAQNLHIPVFTPDVLDIDTWKREIPDHDLLVVASYGKIIPESILDNAKYGGVNIHPSLLPKYRGPAPIPTTILNGDTETGVTIIKMDQELDHGPIIEMKRASVSSGDTFETLAYKLFALGAGILPSVITDYTTSKLSPQEQDHKNATFTKHLTKQDGYFDIANPPSIDRLDRMIRAYHPWPGVWTKIDDKILKLYPERQVQMEGKNILSLHDFLNGYPKMRNILTPILL